MTLFNKRKSLPALYFSLDRKLERAKSQGKLYFYYPLEENEVDKAMVWAVRNKIWVKPDHITNGHTWYKFDGVKGE